MVDGKITVRIATPAYGGAMFMEYVDSLLRGIAHLEQNGVIPSWSFMTKEALITRARDELARKFMYEGHEDYLMFIDADIWFPSNSILKLIKHDKDICVGIYPKKFIYWDRIREAAQRGEQDLEKFGCSYVLNPAKHASDSVALDKNGLVEVMHGGTGFMLIKRKVFTELKSKVPTYRTSLIKNKATGQYLAPLCSQYFGTSIDEGMLLSEDYHFCKLWTDNGGEIYADPTIELRHVGQHVFSGDLILAGRNAT